MKSTLSTGDEKTISRREAKWNGYHLMNYRTAFFNTVNAMNLREKSLARELALLGNQ